TGCGIPLNEVTTIFEQFYRGQAGPLEARGAGLGLAITKSLVALHKSQNWAESQLGEGSRFFFTLSLDSSPS
ncbi:MAG: ATP-binding protein, partial [Candidatus Binatia bacterium]